MPSLNPSGHDPLELITRHDERITQLFKAQQHFKEGYITKQEFEPVKRVVYTTIGLIITVILGAVLHLILKS